MTLGAARLSWLLMLALVPAAARAGTAAPEIPHRGGPQRVDGDAADWGEGALIVEIERPPALGESRARARVRIAWDSRALWALFEVADPTPSRAPADAGGATLFQWDSVELYVDGRGDRERRMGPDDFQVILAPDGRFAVLQGDLLLTELEAMEVPKRERPSVAIATAGRSTADGYVVECAIPFSALGIAPHRGLELALDVALNDWTVEHPPFAQLGYDLETLHKLETVGADGVPAYDANGLAIASAQEAERASYRPWAWSGSGDFGHPERWHRVRLVGAPPLAESVLALLGPGRTLLLGALLTLLLIAATLAGSEWRHRRRIASLLGRIAALERPAAKPSAEAVSKPGMSAAQAIAPDPLEWLEHIAERDSDVAGRDRPLELRAILAIRGRLSQSVKAAELARALFVSLRTLERHLRGTLACSPSELILAVKMREARRLLEQGSLQVQEVAHRVGYDDPAHFSRRFRAYFGLAPSAVAEAGAESRVRSVA